MYSGNLEWGKEHGKFMFSNKDIVSPQVSPMQSAASVTVGEMILIRSEYQKYPVFTNRTDMLRLQVES